MSRWRIRPLDLDEGVAGDRNAETGEPPWGVQAVHRVTHALETGRWGHDDFVDPVEARLVELRDQQYTERHGLLALPTGSASDPRDVAGYALVELPRTDNTHRADVELAIHPDHAGQGVETALLDATMELVRAHDRTVLASFTETPGEPDPGSPIALEAPTGSGRIDGADPLAAAFAAAGFALEQAERYSRLDLPADPALIRSLHADAADRAGSAYRLVSWRDRTPEERVEEIAFLNRRMSTDAPTAGMHTDEEEWDAERVRHLDSSRLERGYGFTLTAAEHIPTGRLVAYTYLTYPLARPAAVYQANTLVLREHRGRRLGMLVKSANLALLAEHRPDGRRVHTWNAEENAHMLGINVALGFRPAGVVGLWQCKL